MITPERRLAQTAAARAAVPKGPPGTVLISTAARVPVELAARIHGMSAVERGQVLAAHALTLPDVGGVDGYAIGYIIRAVGVDGRKSSVRGSDGKTLVFSTAHEADEAYAQLVGPGLTYSTVRASGRLPDYAR